MTASPYDMVAYRPAARSEFRATMTSFCTAAPAPIGVSLRGDRRDRRTGGVLLRPDEVHLSARLVLGHDEGQSAWPVLVKDRTWPGTMLFSIFRPASAARIFSGSSEPALEMAVSSARTVS